MNGIGIGASARRPTETMVLLESLIAPMQVMRKLARALGWAQTLAFVLFPTRAKWLVKTIIVTQSSVGKPLIVIVERMFFALKGTILIAVSICVSI